MSTKPLAEGDVFTIAGYTQTFVAGPPQPPYKQRRRRGRPSLVPGERSIGLTVTLPESLYRRLCYRAKAHRLDFHTYLRRALEFSNEK